MYATLFLLFMNTTVAVPLFCIIGDGSEAHWLLLYFSKTFSLPNSVRKICSIMKMLILQEKEGNEFIIHSSDLAHCLIHQVKDIISLLNQCILYVIYPILMTDFV